MSALIATQSAQSKRPQTHVKSGRVVALEQPTTVEDVCFDKRLAGGPAGDEN